jgi:hypothetical protein
VVRTENDQTQARYEEVGRHNSARRNLLKKAAILTTLLTVCFVIAAEAQTAAPKPDPEFKKLQVLVGHWTYDGEYKAGPWGPATTIKGEWTYQFVLNGFVLQGHCTEKSAQGVVHYLEIDEFDQSAKKIVDSVAGDDGSRYSGSVVVSGNTVTWAGTFYLDGKPYQFREPMVCSADFTNCPAKAEISTDGKTWVPFFETTFIKAKPAAKKK